MTEPDAGPSASRMRASPVITGSVWILIGLAIQSALGFAFWVLAAQVATPGELGRASALFTAIQFVNYASGLGLTVALARHATGTDATADALFGWALVATAVSSLVAGSLYLGLVHSSATDLVRSPGGWLVFCLYTAGTSVALLVDVRLMAARRFGWLVGRVAIVALIRLPFVLVDIGIPTDRWIYDLMLAPIAIGGVIGVLLLPRSGAGGVRLGHPRVVGLMARYAGVNWLATLASQAPQFLLPLLVAQSVSDADFAPFFLAWVMTGVVLLVPGAISQVLLVEGAKDADEIDAVDAGDASAAGLGHRRDRERDAMVFSLGLACVAFAGSLVFRAVSRSLDPDTVLGSVGDVLPGLMVAGIAWAVTAVRLAEARIRKDQIATVAITATLGLGIVIPALLWVPDQGVDGALHAWWLGNGAAALVAMSLHLRRRDAPRLAGLTGS